MEAKTTNTNNQQKPILFFDLETTGTNVATDRIVEISLVKLYPDETQDIITTRINPGIPIPQEATAVHGIADDDVKDLGKSVAKETFLQAVREGADFIGISIMTDEGVEEAKKVVQTFKDAGVRDNVKVIVGGAGVDAQKAAEIIAADGYAEDAGEVVEFLKIFFRA